MLKNLIKEISIFFFKKISVQGNKKSFNKKGGDIGKVNKKPKYQGVKFKKFKKRNRAIKKSLIAYKLVFKVTRNNIFITIIDPLYGHVYYSSGGLKYFYIRKDSVAVANILLGENMAIELRSKFINAVDVVFEGLPFKSHRKYFLKGLTTKGLIVRHVIDKTPIAHNGCTRRKKRRKKLRNQRSKRR